jgi:hypothetical protein
MRAARDSGSRFGAFGIRSETPPEGSGPRSEGPRELLRPGPKGAPRASRACSEAVGSRFTATGTTSDVRIRAGLRPLSTDSVTFWRPHPGDREVVPIVSTGVTVERPSDQVSPLWIRGRRLSTDCGRRKDPQGVREVVHRRPTGWSWLSPAIPSFSTPLSTVRQRDAPDHRVE